jgi:hypothetical protein
MDVSVTLKERERVRKASECHASKLEKLTMKRDMTFKENTTGNDDRKVIKLSNHDLNNEEVDILKKGLGFAIALKTIP